MHWQARLPEIFDQIAQNTPVLEFQADLGTLSILTFQNPLPENLNLGRYWHFEYFYFPDKSMWEK